MPVDDHQVGVEAEEGALQQLGAELDQLAGGAGEASWPVAVDGAGDPGNGQPVESLGQGESGGVGESRDQQARHLGPSGLGKMPDQVVSDGQVASHMPQA